MLMLPDGFSNLPTKCIDSAKKLSEILMQKLYIIVSSDFNIFISLLAQLLYSECFAFLFSQYC